MKFGWIKYQDIIGVMAVGETSPLEGKEHEFALIEGAIVVTNLGSGVRAVIPFEQVKTIFLKSKTLEEK